MNKHATILTINAPLCICIEGHFIVRSNCHYCFEHRNHNRSIYNTLDFTEMCATASPFTSPIVQYRLVHQRASEKQVQPACGGSLPFTLPQFCKLRSMSFIYFITRRILYYDHTQFRTSTAHNRKARIQTMRPPPTGTATQCDIFSHSIR